MVTMKYWMRIAHIIARHSGTWSIKYFKRLLLVISFTRFFFKVYLPSKEHLVVELPHLTFRLVESTSEPGWECKNSRGSRIYGPVSQLKVNVRRTLEMRRHLLAGSRGRGPGVWIEAAWKPWQNVTDWPHCPHSRRGTRLKTWPETKEP